MAGSHGLLPAKRKLLSKSATDTGVLSRVADNDGVINVNKRSTCHLEIGEGPHDGERSLNRDLSPEVVNEAHVVVAHEPCDLIERLREDFEYSFRCLEVMV